MEEKELDRGGIIGSIVGLFLLVTAVIVQSVSSCLIQIVNSFIFPGFIGGCIVNETPIV